MKYKVLRSKRGLTEVISRHLSKRSCPGVVFSFQFETNKGPQRRDMIHNCHKIIIAYVSNIVVSQLQMWQM